MGIMQTDIETQEVQEAQEAEQNHETVIALMEIYLSEWMHRDGVLWQQVFKFFYATLIVMLLPNITGYFSIELPIVPNYAFRIAGIVSAIFFLYVSLGYSKRLEASGNTYQRMINMLPEKFRRVPLKEIPYGKYFAPRMSTTICVLMFVILVMLGVTLLFI